MQTHLQSNKSNPPVKNNAFQNLTTAEKEWSFPVLVKARGALKCKDLMEPMRKVQGRSWAHF